MKYSHQLFPLFLLSFALLFIGCASEPTEQIEQTEAARKEAVEQFADQFATSEWSAAEAAWNDAATALEAEDYRQARTHLLKAVTGYRKARDIAQGKKETLVKEVEGLKIAIEKRAELLRESTSEMRLSSSQTKDLEERFQDFEAKMVEIDQKLEAGAFEEAKTLAGRTIRSVYEAEQEFKK
jgi:hypothetical protein